MVSRYLFSMNVSLPRTWEEFVASQVSSGEFGNASEVVREALRLLREQQEARAVEEMRAAFAHVDPHGGQGEPAPADRALIDQIIRRYRKGKARS
jgi:antitoxin ParD1/3/4